ncbi:DNA-binding transcriptional MerR regulator [Rhodococcus sp. 27YEA15]|uniref:MerR family transcriptional regulator n=1 Tax=Rhodococcus sp. 27YEA15 TaxID=3156259 RepID=UPI003C7C2014
MRISDVARTAGVTARTIRHYHRLGLLAEPTRLSNGYRDYALTDLIGLLRIRWLAAAGVPLGSVATVMASTREKSDADDLEADLSSLVQSLDVELERLQGQRRRLQDMLAAHRSGRPVSPLPSGLAMAFAELIEDESDPATRQEFERDRDAWELLAISGTGPAELFDGAARVLADSEKRAETIELYRRFAAVAGADPDAVQIEIGTLAGDLVSVLRREYADVDLFDSASFPESVVSVESIVPDRAQQKVLALVLRDLRSEP